MRMRSFLPLCNSDADICTDRSNKIPKTQKDTGNMYVLHREAHRQITPDSFVENLRTQRSHSGYYLFIQQSSQMFD